MKERMQIGASSPWRYMLPGPTLVLRTEAAAGNIATNIMESSSETAERAESVWFIENLRHKC